MCMSPFAPVLGNTGTLGAKKIWYKMMMLASEAGPGERSPLLAPLKSALSAKRTGRFCRSALPIFGAAVNISSVFCTGNTAPWKNTPRAHARSALCALDFRGLVESADPALALHGTISITNSAMKCDLLFISSAYEKRG